MELRRGEESPSLHCLATSLCVQQRGPLGQGVSAVGSVAGAAGGQGQCCG